MVDNAYKEKYWKLYVEKKLKIETDDGSTTLTNSDIHMDEMEISESLCSQQNLVFGSCEASQVQFKISNVFSPMYGKWITISETLEGVDETPFRFGRYKVVSDLPAADRKYRDNTAYDAMYDILGADMADWYNTILPNEDSQVTLRQFRASFIHHFGLEEEEVELVNDNMTVGRTIQPEHISGKDIITAICEINGCFGHITRDGKFRYAMLPRFIQGLYPRNDLYPADGLYPQDPNSERLGSGVYINSKYEDFQVKTIDKIQIRQEENDIGAIYPDTEIDPEENCYIVQNNFLVYGKGHEELSEIARRLLGVISGVIYRPYSGEFVGNPCIEVGDAIRFTADQNLIETYVLQRRLEGTQQIRDFYEADGQEKYQENVNGVQTSIQQLQGKSFKLEKTVEGLNAEIVDVAAGLDAKITATAGQFQVELNNSVSQLNNTITATAGELRAELANTKDGLETTILVTAGQIRGELNDTAAGLQTEISTTAAGLEGQITDTANGLQTQISANANGLAAEITRASTAEGILSTSISATAEGLSTEVSRATEAEGILSQSVSNVTLTADGLYADIYNDGGLQAQIQATAEGLNSKVSKGDVSSEISQEAGKVSIKSNRFSLESTNCTITEDGKITAQNCEISGTFKASIIKNSKLTLENDYMTFEIGGKIYGDALREILVLGFSGSTLNIGEYKSYTNPAALKNVNINVREISAGWKEDPGHCSLTLYMGDYIRIHEKSSLDTYLSIDKKETNYYRIYPYGGKWDLGYSSQGFETLYISTIQHGGKAFSNITGKVGFFGETPVAKQTVATISSTSSATVASNASKINDIINALKKYGLM